MKEKTSITLSPEVTGIDRIAGSKQSRSVLIEAVLIQYLRNRARAQVEARDLELINTAADELNAEWTTYSGISRPRPTGADEKRRNLSRSSSQRRSQTLPVLRGGKPPDPDRFWVWERLPHSFIELRGR